MLTSGNRAILLAGASLGMMMTPAERRAGRFMRAPDHGDAAAALFDAPQPAGDPPPPPPSGEAPPPPDPNTPPVPPPAWLESFSAEPIDADTPSHRDWIAKKGFKSLDDMAKSQRELERWRGQNGNRIEVPKEGATAEQIAAYQRAIGVPEKADGYEIKLPEGVEGALDERLVGSFREAALAAGVPKGAAEGIGKWFIDFQLDMNAAVIAQRKDETEATLKEWGPNADRYKALAGRAAEKLGLDRGAIADIQQGFGAKRTLNLLKALGEGLAEDSMLEGGGKQKFGITVDQARAQKDQLMEDKAFTAKLREKDPEATARLERLNAVITADMDAKQGRAPA